jgi:hypothetical protein
MHLRLLGPLFVLLTFAAAGAGSGGEIMVLPSIRVQFEIPPGWHAVENIAVAESLKRVRFSDSEVNRYLRERARLPKLAFTKHPADFPSLNPTLQIYSVPGPYDPKDIVSSTLTQAARLDGFKIVEATRAYSILHRSAAIAQATFTLGSESSQHTFRVHARTLVVGDHDEAVVFGLSCAAAGEDSCEVEWKRLLASVAPRDPR